MSTLQHVTDNLVHLHSALQVGPPLSFETVQSRLGPGLNTPQHAALLAAHMLGFDPADASCVAAAWQSQTERTGRFDPAAWPADAADFGLPSWPRTEAFAPCPAQLGLYAVLPDAQWVFRMARVGVSTLQLRFKSDDAHAIDLEVKTAVQAVRSSASLLFINDHWQAAVKHGAYGVHLGQEDLADADLSAIRRAGLRLGISTHGYTEMQLADALSPSYIAMGAVFPTTLKNMPTAPQGLGRLAVYAQLLKQHALVGIGGIDISRFEAVRATGVGSVAVVRAITGANDPEAAALALMHLMA